MAKKASVIDGAFEAAAGTIWVVPSVEESLVGGMRTGDSDKELPKGTVVAVGAVPRQFKSHRLAIGSVAVYSRTVANVMKLPVIGDDGVVEDREVKCVLWTDLRGDFPPRGVTAGRKTMVYAIYQKVRGYLLRFSIPLSIGFSVGVIVGSVIWSWSWFRDKVVSGGRSLFSPKSKE